MLITKTIVVGKSTLRFTFGLIVGQLTTLNAFGLLLSISRQIA